MAELVRVDAEPGFEALFDSSPAALVLLEPNGSIRRANRGFAEWLGSGFAELRKRNWWNLVHASDLGAALLSFSQLVSGEAGGRIEFSARFAAEAEATRWGLVRCSLVRCLSGGDIVVFAEISDRTTLREAQLQSAAMRARILQLEQESAALRSVLRVAAEGLTSPESIAAIDPVRALCQSAGMPLKIESCALDELVRGVIAGIDKEAAGRLWSIADLPVVAGSPEMLEHLFDELLRAACRRPSDNRNRTIEIGSYLENHVPVVFIRYCGDRRDDKTLDEFPDSSGWARWRTAILRHGGTSWIDDDNDGQITICFSLEPLPGRT